MLKGVCIGAGYFSQFHFEAWQRMEDLVITGVCDLDRNKAEDIVGQFGFGKAYIDFEEMLVQQAPDFVDIITPPETHLELIQLAIKHNVHIICQKPLAPSYDVALKIRDELSKSQVRFMVHENWRFQPWYREIKSLIENEDVIAINHRMRMGDGWQADAYMNRQPYFREMERLLMYETGIHFIDTFRFLAGEMTSVYAKLKRLNTNIRGEDFAWVQFEFESGTLGLLDANRYNESLADDPRLTFGEMLLETRNSSIRLYTDGSITVQKLGEKERNHTYEVRKIGFAADCVFQTQSHFIEQLKSEKPFETNIVDYMKNLEVQEAVYESSMSGLPVLIS